MVWYQSITPNSFGRQINKNLGSKVDAYLASMSSPKIGSFTEEGVLTSTRAESLPEEDFSAAALEVKAFEE